MGRTHRDIIANLPQYRQEAIADEALQVERQYIMRSKLPDDSRGVYFLAGPYTGHVHGRHLAFETLTKVAGELIKCGVNVFSPITMSHPICELDHRHGLDASYWLSVNTPFFDLCSGLIVVELEGWEVATGVMIERQAFAERGKPIYFIDPREFIRT